MVTIITGGSNSIREDMFVERIKKAVESGENVLVIIPDQFSFEYEKKLYNAMGARLFNGIKTAGFNRLAERIAAEYGGYSRENAGDNAKIILMYKAVRRLSHTGSVRFYKKSLDKGSFISELIDLVGQLRESGVTPEVLQLAAERLNGSVSLKLFDISRIYSYYLEELDNANMKDSLSSMAEGVKLADKNEYFKDLSVFVTSFNSFTYDEKKMLDLCISQGKDFTVSLLLDDECTSKYRSHPFGVTVRTQQHIVDMAKAHNKSVEFLSADKSYYRSRDIFYLSKHMFNFDRTEYKTVSDDVQVYSADDMYEEADFICAEICRLVREEGYRFNDIAVTVRDLTKCESVFQGAMEKYDIPYFLDKRDNISASAIVHYINALFKTVLTRKFKTDNIMKLIKSPLYSILNYDVKELEDYCYKWSVEGNMWLSPFTVGEKQDNLDKINGLRSQIIEPLVRFKEQSKDASAKEICEAFYKLLDEIQLSQRTYSLVKRASRSGNETQTELARGLKQLWNLSLSAVKSIYEILGDEKISLRQYYELYRIMLSQMKISNPPQKLDCVRITDAARSRADDVKVTFAAEVNDGIFPAPVKQGGLVTEHEKELLRQSENITIEANALSDFQNERLVAYAALTSPSDKLYLSYSKSDLLGNEKRPSMLVKEVREILGVGVKNINSLPIDFFCTSYKTAYAKYVEHSRDKTSEMQSIYESVMGSALYYDRLSNLRKANAKPDYKMSPENARETFFRGSVTEVSPTKLDTFYKCPFMYYCNYGLKLRPVDKIKIGGANTGNVIHGLLENILRNPESKSAEDVYRKDFILMQDDSIKEFIHNYFVKFYETQFGGDFGKNSTFGYEFEKLERKAFFIVKFVQKELIKSGFTPVALEYKITHKDREDNLELELNDGRKIVLIGTIDRADIIEDEDGQKYIRIVDYKTGTIDFSFGNLYNGLNLQMLVYLSTLLETTNEINRDEALKQAGVFYFKFKEAPKLDEDNERTDEEQYEMACSDSIEAFKQSGKMTDIGVVDNAVGRVISAQSRRYIKMNDRMFSAMREFAKLKVKEYGNSLLEGKISAKPLSDACSYCSYQSICGMAFPEEAINAGDKIYAELLNDRLSEIADEMESGNQKGGDGK